MPDGNEQVTFQSPTTGAVQPVPIEHWDTALNQGYKPVSHKVMYSPDGNRGMVRNEEMPDYVKQGYQTTPKTQFEKDRPGKGITTEGMGTAAWEGVKGLGSGLLGMVDPTRGLSGAGLSVLGLNPRSGTAGERLNEVPLVGAAKEAYAAYKDPEADSFDVATAGPGSMVGMSSSAAREAASRGEGGKILGQAAVPAGVAIGGPLVSEAVGAARPALQRAVYKEMPAGGAPQLTKGARFASGIAGGGAGGLLGHASGVPGAGYMGGHLGLLTGPSLLETVAGTPELGDIRNPGPFGKIPIRAPRPVMETPPSPPNPFSGMTSSKNPPPTALPPSRTSVLGNQPNVELVGKFKSPEPSRIVSPESTPPDFKVTYQSVPQEQLLGKVKSGDIEAIREWQRRGLDLPPNVGFMLEGGAGAKPWRAYKR